MTKVVNFVLIILVLGIFCAPGALAQTTEISYQGSLKDGTSLASGNYDIEFRLYNAATGGSLIGTEIFLSPVAVTEGVFSVKLDFGANGFPGQDRYLEIAVRRTGVGSLVTLGPRQKIGSAPYAVQSLQAATATTALIASNAQALGGVNASQYIVTTDTRLTDARNPLGGSPNYIQNTVSQQASSNFNVSGTGTAGIFSAGTRFNFGSEHILSAPGLDNIFAGSASGLLNLGNNNAFFGAKAGQENKQGRENSFFGSYAGQNNVTGNGNSFFGYFAGNATTSGSENSFFGNRSGQVNTSGAFNSFFGTFSGFFNSTGSDNSYFGNSAGYNNTNGNRNSFFGSQAGQQNTGGSDNAFLGSFAGNANTLGADNSYVGSNAGRTNATGINNSFMGARAGHNNTASNNSFFGTEAGRFNTSGANNTFIGRNAGHDNTTGELNVFVGVNAGNSNNLGRLNTIIGAEADVLGNNLQYATAIGAEAIVNTSNTVVLGRPADAVRVPGNLNVMGTLTAANLSVQATNITGVIGTANGGTGLSAAGMAGRFLRSDGTNWTSSPFTVADVPSGSAFYVQNSTTQQGSTNFNISGNGTAGGTLWGNAVNSSTQYNIGGGRVLIAAGSNLFAGLTAGNANTTGASNAFVGNGAGSLNSSGSGNSFFGANAGLNSSSGGNNTFSGASAGNGNTIGANNSFFGVNAGQTNTIGNNNTVVGANANVGGNNLTYATAIGADAVVSTNNTVVLGRSVDTVRAPGNLQVDGNLIANNFSVNASNLTGTVLVGNGGTGMSSPGAAGNYLRSNGSIWQTSAIAAGDIPSGSTNYIQNGLAEQSSTNFNISGNGTAGGTFWGNAINSSTNYNIAGTRVLSNTGSSNIFVGAGTATTGSGNSFFGFGAGAANTTGFSNTILGSGANVGVGNLSFATAVGAGATVSNNNSVVLGRAADTVRVPGDMVVTGNLTAPSLSVSASNITGTLGMANGGTGVIASGSSGNVLRSNGTTWASSALQASDIPSLAANYVQNTTSQQVGANFNVGGNGTVGGNLTVGGAINGNLAASNLTGILGISNGGTGLNSPGLNGQFLRSNGTGFTTTALTTLDIPSLASSYIQNNPGSPQSGSFSVGGSGAVGTNLNVGGSGSFGTSLSANSLSVTGTSTFGSNVTVTGNLNVNGNLGGTFTVPATSIAGTLGVANGGTGITSAGTNGHFLKSTGTGFTTAALTAAELPAGSANYIQNGTTPQAGTDFSVAGSGAVGTTLNVGTNLNVGNNASVSGNMTVTGGLTVNGALNGSFTVAASNITGTLAANRGGTGMAVSSGTDFLRGNGTGGWTTGALSAGDIPSLGGTYIQNTTIQQTGNFNVSGSGTVAGTFNAGIVNAAMQFNLNGTRVLSTTGTGNVFAGPSAGTTGSNNSFVGSSAGDGNTTGSNNTVVGANADVGSGNLNNATAIGANATVTASNALVLGGVTGQNGGTSVNVGIGTTAPKTRLEVTGGDIHVTDPGQGIILKSPNGTVCRLLSINDLGAMVLTVVTCP
jgi:hypothetical protein